MRLTLVIIFILINIYYDTTSIFAADVIGPKGKSSNARSVIEDTAKEWTGELFRKGEGVFYIRIFLTDFKIAEDENFLRTSIQFQVEDVFRKKRVTFSQPAYASLEEDSDPKLWKLSEGEYRITKIFLVDTEGTTRVWRPEKTSKTFVIKGRKISNLGRWRISPEKKKSLKVALKMIETEVSPEDKMMYNQIDGVIDGMTGSIQKKFLGRANLPNKEEMLKNTLSKSYTFTRQISMFYKVNLYRHNKYSKKVAKTLSAHDAKFRKCYTDVLELNESVKGQVKFRFSLPKESKSMDRVQLSYENVRDINLTNCLYRNLLDMRIALPETVRQGELTYSFDSF